MYVYKCTSQAGEKILTFDFQADDNQFLFSRLKRFQAENADPHDHSGCTHGEISRENGYKFLCEIPTGCPHQWQKKDYRRCISNFFGRNKRCTLAIKREVYWCRSHYQTNAFKRENWKYQRLGLIQEQACRIEEDSGARYTICLKNEEAERLNNWAINGEDLPVKAVKHKRGQSFRAPMWALRFMENEWVGTDKTLDEVFEFVAWTNQLLRTGRIQDIPIIEFLPQFENVKITLQKAQKDSIARAKSRGLNARNDVEIPDASNAVDILAIAEEAEEMVESDSDDSDDSDDGEDSEDSDDSDDSDDGDDSYDSEDAANTGDVEMADADRDSDATISEAGSPNIDESHLHTGSVKLAHRRPGGSRQNAHDARGFNPINDPRSSTPPGNPPHSAAPPPTPIPRNAVVAPAPQQSSSSSSSSSTAVVADRDHDLMLLDQHLDQHLRSCDLQLTTATHMALGARNAVQLANIALNHPIVESLDRSLSLIQQVREAVQQQQQRHGRPLSRVDAISGRVQKP
jgi:hypothetical protein